MNQKNVDAIVPRSKLCDFYEVIRTNSPALFWFTSKVYHCFVRGPNTTQCKSNQILNLFFFQYYEMSYGLNVEMHKQVITKYHLLNTFNWNSKSNYIFVDF